MKLAKFAPHEDVPFYGIFGFQSLLMIRGLSLKITLFIRHSYIHGSLFLWRVNF